MCVNIVNADKHPYTHTHHRQPCNKPSLCAAPGVKTSPKSQGSAAPNRKAWPGALALSL